MMKTCFGNKYIFFSNDIKTTMDSPKRHDLFKVDENMERLNTEKSEILHHIVAQLLFVYKRASLDIELTIAFLCTRVTKSTQENWLKLKILLCYLKRPLNMQWSIEVDGLSIIQSWLDESYAIQADTKGNTGEVTSFWLRVTHAKISKQKMNTKSSTESDIVGASDYLDHIVWLDGFMKNQGYPLSRKFFY